MGRVLFVNRVFPPAGGATGDLLAELADDLAGRGWDVTVLTGRPDGAPRRERLPSGVRVERVGHLAAGRAGIARRAARYAALYPALLARALRLPRPDVLVTKTDPPMLALLGAAVARLRRVPAVHWAQDLYPEVAVALGVVPERAARALRRASTAALRRHARVVSIGACMTERLVARGLPRTAIVEIPNWAQEGIAPVEPNALRATLAPPEAFVVMYSGNMGLAHPFEAMLGAAALLQAEAPDVRFVFVGDGARRAWLEAEAARRGLTTVSFAPFQPKERLGESLSAADVHLISMEPELCGIVVPSKVYGVAAAGRPAVFLGPPESEAARFLEATCAGTIVAQPGAPGGGEDVARAILAWRDDPERRRAAGERASAAAAAGRRTAFDRFATVLTCVSTGDE